MTALQARRSHELSQKSLSGATGERNPRSPSFGRRGAFPAKAKEGFVSQDLWSCVMNRSLTRALLIATAATTILLSGCAYTAYPDVAYASPYYDGYYGPYWDGYWGPDGFFYFFDVHANHFRRDDGHHFRHDMAPGFAGVAPHRNFAHAMPGNPSHAFGGPVRGGGGAREHRG